jgi:hypothetical protein
MKFGHACTSLEACLAGDCPPKRPITKTGAVVAKRTLRLHSAVLLLIIKRTIDKPRTGLKDGMNRELPRNALRSEA